MTVFISYQRIDEAKARSIRDQLSAFAINSYLDVMDPALRSAESVTKRILEALESCTHLMAVLSQTTRLSWWVPFEIGVATRSERRITSYRRDTSELPEFLKIWPVMDYDSQLADFARRYFEDSAHTEKSYRFSESYSKPIRSAGAFHAALKRDLGQT